MEAAGSSMRFTKRKHSHDGRSLISALFPSTVVVTSFDSFKLYFIPESLITDYWCRLNS